MRSEVRSVLEMARRVREFCGAHLSLEPGYAPIVARIEDRLTRAETIEARERTGREAARGARAHRKELRRVLHFQLIRYLVAVGSVAARDRAELTGRFKLPSGSAPNAAFLAAVKGLLTNAESQKELLAKVGMKDGLLEKLTGMVGEFEAAVEAVRVGRREHIGARADLESLTAELMDQVKVLDGMTRYGFGDNPDMMAEWKAVKAVPAVRGKALPQDPGPTPGGVAPAA
jgi:hypothetical protein